MRRHALSAATPDRAPAYHATHAPTNAAVLYGHATVTFFYPSDRQVYKATQKMTNERDRYGARELLVFFFLLNISEKRLSRFL